MSRYEIKLVGAERDYGRVHAELLVLPALLRPLHPPRLVQSLYLDSADGRALHDNLAGISERQKVRFRWYGKATEHVQGQLEQKRRSNALGDKDVFPVAQPIHVAGASRHGFVAALRAELPAAAQELLHGLQPAQWVRYRRDYLATADGTLRVTLDRQLAAFDQRFDRVLSCRRSTPLPRVLVVEVKADSSQRDAIERWLQHVPLRPTRCSKFVLASSPADGPEASQYD